MGEVAVGMRISNQRQSRAKHACLAMQCAINDLRHTLRVQHEIADGSYC